MKQVLFFDLNHTLADVNKTFDAAFLHTIEAYTARLDTGDNDSEALPKRMLSRFKKTKRIGRKTGKTNDLSCLREAISILPFDVTDNFLKRLLTEINQRRKRTMQDVPGARETLNSLSQKYKLAVISNSRGERVEESIRLLGLSDIIPAASQFTPDKTGARKPHPDAFKKALVAMGVKPEEAVMVGNSWSNDMIGAAKVGMEAVWLQTKRKNANKISRSYSGSKIRVIRDIRQLPDIILD